MLALLCCAPAASADWSGDGKGDVLAVNGNGALMMYRGNGAGRFVSPYPQIGSGWGSFTALLATDWSGDGRADLLARKSDGGLLMYRGNARGGFSPARARRSAAAGAASRRCWRPATSAATARTTSSPASPTVAPALPRQRRQRLRGRRGQDRLRLGGFTALLAPGDWNGDGKADVLARTRPTGSCSSTAATARAAG